MIEDSVDAFVTRWRGHAAEVELFPRHEGSPLFECRAGTAVLQLFERTGPYLWRPGAGRVIIHPVTDHLEVVSGEAAPASADAGPVTPESVEVPKEGQPAPEPGTEGAVPRSPEKVVATIDVEGVSRLRVCGRVVERDGQVLVVHAGVPLVVGVQGAVPDRAVPGAWVRFDNVAPVHGFVLDDVRRRLVAERPDDAI